MSEVLDPAMGSGHFLVATVDFLTDRLIAILQRYPHNPIFQRLQTIRAEIRASLTEQGLAADVIPDEQLSDARLLRRLVMKRCVYGVDLNDMAVELARLSLWLHSFTVGAPLSFLDHHLKWGNSLVGARVREVQRAMEGTEVGGGLATQLDLFTTGSAFAEMLNVASIMEELIQLADANAQQVEQSAILYADYEQRAIPVKRLLDLWVIQYFGSKEARQLLTLYKGQEEVHALIEALMGRRELGQSDQKAVSLARELFNQHRFLHWELDFPEVFINLVRKAWKEPEEAGFDAVVGNPPYDVLSDKEREEDLAGVKLYFSSTAELSNALGRKIDLYRLFISKSLSISHPGAYIGLIVPLSLLADQQTGKLRKYLIKEHCLIRVDAFPQKDNPYRRIFEEAKLPTCVLIMRVGLSEEKTQVVIHPGNLIEESSGSYSYDRSDIAALDYVVFMLRSNQELDLVIRLVKGEKFIKIGDMLQTYQGEINETTMRRLLKTDPSSGPKVLRGSNIQRYVFIEESKQGTDKYLDIKAYLQAVEGEKRLHANLPRIGYQRNAALDNWRRLIFCRLPNPSYCFDSISYYIATSVESAHFFLALLNSRLLEWYFRLSSTNNHVSTSEIARLPMPRLLSSTSPSTHAHLVAEAQELYQQHMQGIGTPTDWRGWRGAWHPLWDWAGARLPQQGDGTPDPANEQSDAVHDLLAFLAERMVALHKEKQTEAKSFLDWLEGETDSRVAAWTLKTIMQEYWAHPWDEITRALQKNRGRFAQMQGLRGKEADRALAPLLLEVSTAWEASTAGLRPLLASIQATDRLIDLLVYRLYGLTDEEIDIVEGSSNPV